MSRRTVITLWSLFAVTVVGLQVAPSAAWRDLVQIVVAAGALAIAWVHVLRRPDVLRRGWRTLVVAVTVLGLGDALAAFEARVVLIDFSLRPSTVLTLSGYCLLGAGALQFARHRGRGRPAPGRIEAAIFAFGALVPLLVFLIIPVVGSSEYAVAQKTTTVAFALADLAVATVIAQLTLTTGFRSRSFALLATALLVSLAGNFWWAILATQGSGSAPPGIKMLWLTAFILFAAGVAHPSMREFTLGRGWQEEISSQRRVWLMGVGQAMPALALVASSLLDTDHSHLVIALGALAVTVLVAARMTGLLDRIDEQSSQLAELARSDDLTGLHNRRSWNHELARACATAGAEGRSLSIALIDLDHFKVFNDTYGHPAGDRLLTEAAAVWTSLLRPGDVLARYGGEEFSMILPATSLREAVELVDRLRVATPQGQRFSAGVALWEPGSDPTDTVADADTALYLAKRSGRDRVLAGPERGDRELPPRLQALRIVVQPIVRADDLGVVAHEALSRFPHEPDVPRVFAQAHERGYGDLLEIAAIRRALAADGRPRGTELYVNVSERAMRSTRFWGDLPDDLAGVVMELHEDRDGLDDATVRDYLDRFRQRGARIGMDDLGVRATDLARVVTLEPDVVKIDRSLVAGCDVNGGQADVVRMLVDFARSRGVDVCVEGVETVGELAVVRDAGATLVQGYLVARPSPQWQQQRVGVTGAPVEDPPLPRQR